MSREKTLSRLRQIEALLAKHEVNKVRFVAHLASQLHEASDRDGIEVVRQAIVDGLFGTMGSLGDIVTSKRNGHVVEDEAEANRCLEALTEALWLEVRR